MKIDLHIHTTAYSSCSRMSPDDMMKAAVAAGLDGVCITEHNRVWSADDAEALSRKHGIAVFRGMEVTTTAGDVLTFGLYEPPSKLVTPEELRLLADHTNALLIAAHPFRGFLVFGFGGRISPADAMTSPIFKSVHGLEVCNGLVTNEENELAKQVADMLSLAGTGGSDAHKAEAVGTCITEFHDQIRDESRLIEALRNSEFDLIRAK
jgi:predicted metal-dependent phosphoesterase TrpH